MRPAISFLRLNFQLVIDRANAGYSLRNLPNCLLFILSFDRAPQRHLAVFGDDRHILGGGGEIVLGHDLLADETGNFTVGLRGALIQGAQRILGQVWFIDPRVVQLTGGGGVGLVRVHGINPVWPIRVSGCGRQKIGGFGLGPRWRIVEILR